MSRFEIKPPWTPTIVPNVPRLFRDDVCLGGIHWWRREEDRLIVGLYGNGLFSVEIPATHPDYPAIAEHCRT